MLDRIRIVLVNTSHPGNIGAAARAMKNMGLSRLYLVQPKDYPCDEAYSRAASAIDVLHHATVVDSLAEALHGCVWMAGASARTRTVPWPMYEPRESAAVCMQNTAQGEVAVVFGRERSGLSNDELELCNALVHIPTNPEYSSLNVAAAVQVLCYELWLASPEYTGIEVSIGNTHPDDAPASADLLDGMYAHMDRMLEHIGFYGASNPDVIMRRMKGLLNRTQPTLREVAILRGIFSAAQGKKRRSNSD